MRSLVQVVARVDAPYVPTDAVHLRLVDHGGSELTENEVGQSRGLSDEGKSPAEGFFFGEARNRNWRYNIVTLTNSVPVKPAYNPISRTFDVVLSFVASEASLTEDSPHELIFNLFAGYGSPSETILVPPLAQSRVKVSSLLNAGEAEVDLKWSPEERAKLSVQDISKGANQHAFGRLHISIVEKPVWQQLCGSTLAQYAGLILHHPTARSFVSSSLKHSSFGLDTQTQEDHEVIGSEIAFESSLSFTVPSQVLRMRLARLVEHCQRWGKLHSAVHIANCHFDSEALALKYGYQRVRLTLTSASDLAQTQHDSPAGTGETNPVAKKAANFSGALRGMLQGAQKRMDSNTAGFTAPFQNPFMSSSSSSPVASSQRLCKPFVRVSFQHPAGHRVNIGRTVAEIRTQNPVFRSCSLESEFAYLDGPNTLAFYVPRNPDVLIMFEVFHERFSTLTQRTTHVPMMQACYPLSTLLAMQSNAASDSSPNISLNLYAHDQQRDEVLGTLQVIARSNCPFNDETGEPAPSYVPGNAFYFHWGVRWIDDYLQRLNEDVVTLNQLLKVCQESEENITNELQADTLLTSCMKQSVHKKDFKVGAIPTNLHASFWVVESRRAKGSETAVSSAYRASNPPPAHPPPPPPPPPPPRPSRPSTMPSPPSSPPARSPVRQRPPAPVRAKGEPDHDTADEHAFRGPSKSVSSGSEGRPVAPRRSAPSRTQMQERSQSAADVDLIVGARRSAHAAAFAARAENAPTRSRVPEVFGIFPITTCGAPAAHWLGFNSTSTLLYERTRLHQLSRSAQHGWAPFFPDNMPHVNTSAAEAADSVKQWQVLAECSRKHFLRESVVLSQALSSLVTCFVAELAVRLSGSDIAVHHVSQWAESGAVGGLWIRQLYEIGFLVGWESLVSSQGKELGMLEDAIAGMEALEKTTRFHIIPYDEMADCGFSSRASQTLFHKPGCQIYVHVSDGSDSRESPRGLGSGNSAREASEIQVYIAVPTAEYRELIAPVTSDKLMRGIAVVPVLFTQGINETQTLANLTTFLTETAGSTRQWDLNHASLRRVEKYLESYRDWLRICGYGVARNGKEPETLRLATESLKYAVFAQQRSSKDVQVLISAENAVRALNGGRITFCKSGKDRTAMSVTLEQARLLQATPLPEGQNLKHIDDLAVANLMREFGGRIVVAEKNVGRPKYSFNAAQRQMLPSQYRPPTSTIQDFYTSVLARDS